MNTLPSLLLLHWKTQSWMNLPEDRILWGPVEKIIREVLFGEGEEEPLTQINARIWGSAVTNCSMTREYCSRKVINGRILFKFRRPCLSA